MSQATDKSVSATEIVAYHKLTSGLYNFFSRLFHHEVDQEFLNLVLASVSNLPAFMGEESALIALQQALSRLDAGADTLVELASVYAKQFLGMHPSEKNVSLCQSVYTSPKHQTHQESLVAARVSYNAEGLALAEEEDIPDDHLSVLLAFLGRKAACIAAQPMDFPQSSWMEPILAQASFREKHLLNWLEALLKRAESLMPSSFYTLWLHYLLEFANYDQWESDLILADLSAGFLDNKSRLSAV